MACGHGGKKRGGHGHGHGHQGGRHGCTCGCDCGCDCGCGGHGHFGRRFLTRDERIANLEEYLEALRQEAKAVEERIEDMRT
jgi:hypothetical protein